MSGPGHVPILSLAIGSALLLSVALAVLGAPLQTPEAPTGIVSFELAGSEARARAILDSWDERARLHAALVLGLDYLYLVIYALAIGLACRRMAVFVGSNAPRLALLGVGLAWAQPLAALLDALENFALAAMLLGEPSQALARMAFVCALPKFAIVAAGILYVLLAGLARLRTRARQT